MGSLQIHYAYKKGCDICPLEIDYSVEPIIKLNLSLFSFKLNYDSEVLNAGEDDILEKSIGKTFTPPNKYSFTISETVSSYGKNGAGKRPYLKSTNFRSFSSKGAGKTMAQIDLALLAIEATIWFTDMARVQIDLSTASNQSLNMLNSVNHLEDALNKGDVIPNFVSQSAQSSQIYEDIINVIFSGEVSNTYPGTVMFTDDKGHEYVSGTKRYEKFVTDLGVGIYNDAIKNSNADK